jgi:hypothetical protein
MPPTPARVEHGAEDTGLFCSVSRCLMSDVTTHIRFPIHVICHGVQLICWPKVASEGDVCMYPCVCHTISHLQYMKDSSDGRLSSHPATLYTIS